MQDQQTVMVQGLGTLYDLHRAPDQKKWIRENRRALQNDAPGVDDPWILVFDHGANWIDALVGNSTEIDSYLQPGSKGMQPLLAVELDPGINRKTRKIPASVESGLEDLSTAVRYGDLFLEIEDADIDVNRLFGGPEALVWEAWPSDAVVEYANPRARSFRGPLVEALRYLVDMGKRAEANGHSAPDHNPEECSQAVRKWVATEIVVAGLYALEKKSKAHSLSVMDEWVKNPESRRFAVL